MVVEDCWSIKAAQLTILVTKQDIEPSSIFLEDLNIESWQTKQHLFHTDDCIEKLQYYKCESPMKLPVTTMKPVDVETGMFFYINFQS